MHLMSRQRMWTAAEKLRIVEEARQAGATMAEVARRHGVRGEDLYEWRRAVRDGRQLEDDAPAGFVPVVITDEQPRSSRRDQAPLGANTTVQLALPGGETLSFDARLEPELLYRLLDVLRR